MLYLKKLSFSLQLLEKGLELLEKPNADGRSKGKAVVSSSSDSGRRLEGEE